MSVYQAVSRSLAAIVVASVVLGGLLNVAQETRAQPDMNAPWSEPELVATIASSPVVGIDASGNVSVLWSDGLDVFFRSRAADGTWRAVEQVDDSARDGSQNNPNVAVDTAGRVYAAWIDETPYPEHIVSLHFRVRDTNGQWGAVELVANEPIKVSPGLAIDGSGRIYVLWRDDTSAEIKLRVRSSDGSWGSVETVGAGVTHNQSIAVDTAGNTYILLNNSGAAYLRYRSATGEWEAIEAISDTDGYGAEAIDVNDAGDIYVLLTRSDYIGELYMNHRPVGQNWQGNVLIATREDSCPFCLNPNLALGADGNGYFVWLGDRGDDIYTGNRVYAAYRWQDGLWGNTALVYDTIFDVDSLKIVADAAGNTYYFVWAVTGSSSIYLSTASKPDDDPDLSTSRKIVAPGGVYPGDIVEYAFEVHNDGKTTDFVLTDTIPISTTFVPNSGWSDTGVLTASAQGITWTAVSTMGTTIRAGFSVTVYPDGGTAQTAQTPRVLANVAELSFGANERMPLTALVIVNPIQVYLPSVMREQ